MHDRESELAAIKEVNLTVIAAAYGYEVNRKKSTRASVLMSSGSDKILVSKQGSHYVYCSVFDERSRGTAIDFAQHVIEPGCSIGRARQLLRPFLDYSYVSQVETRFAQSVAKGVEPNQIDLAGLAARYARFVAIDKPHSYLCETRGVPLAILRRPELRGRVLHCPRRQSVVFPHWGSIEAANALSNEVCGYEIKGRGVNLFSKGGQKGLWMSATSANDRVLAIAESGLDALSFLAMRGEEGTRVASISGHMNRSQPELLRQAISSLPPGSQVVAAFDNDRGGDLLTQRLEDVLREAGRSDVSLREDRPKSRGADWNQVLVEQKIGPSWRQTLARPGMSP